MSRSIGAKTENAEKNMQVHLQELKAREQAIRTASVEFSVKARSAKNNALKQWKSGKRVHANSLAEESALYLQESEKLMQMACNLSRVHAKLTVSLKTRAATGDIVKLSADLKKVLSVKDDQLSDTVDIFAAQLDALSVQADIINDTLTNSYAVKAKDSYVNDILGEFELMDQANDLSILSKLDTAKGAFTQPTLNVDEKDTELQERFDKLKAVKN